MEIAGYYGKHYFCVCLSSWLTQSHLLFSKRMCHHSNTTVTHMWLTGAPPHTDGHSRSRHSCLLLTRCWHERKWCSDVRKTRWHINPLFIHYLFQELHQDMSPIKKNGRCVIADVLYRRTEPPLCSSIIQTLSVKVYDRASSPESSERRYIGSLLTRWCLKIHVNHVLTDSTHSLVS